MKTDVVGVARNPNVLVNIVQKELPVIAQQIVYVQETHVVKDSMLLYVIVEMHHLMIVDLVVLVIVAVQEHQVKWVKIINYINITDPKREEKICQIL
jgi:hypothetical protein